MQCEDVIQKLAAQCNDQDLAVLAEHLAGCAACTEWAKRASQLDRLWEATRPADPTPEAWEMVWTRISEALDSSTPVHDGCSANAPVSRNGSANEIIPLAAEPSRLNRARPWRFAAITWFGLAQAAAVLVVVALSSLPPAQKSHVTKLHSTTPVIAGSSSMNAALVSIDIEEGSPVVIRLEGEKPEVLVLKSESSPFGIDDLLLMFNHVESMAPNSVVAMNEGVTP